MKDIENKDQITILTNVGHIGTLTGVIRDMIEDGLKNRELTGYYGEKAISLTHMIDGYVRESLACAEALEIAEEV